VKEDAEKSMVGGETGSMKHLRVELEIY
jgi:hypothetical protein